jgi:hypothetical protein
MNKVQIEVHESFPRQTWRNRCRILTANGPFDLVIPVSRPRGNHTPTAEVLTSMHAPWQKQHWRTLSSAYAKSPFFLYYQDLLQPFYEQVRPWRLVSWNEALMRALLPEAGLDIHPGQTEYFEKTPQQHADFRSHFSPKQSRDKARAWIEWPRYQQVFPHAQGFQPAMSIIDLLFNLGPDAGAYVREVSASIRQAWP